MIDPIVSSALIGSGLSLAGSGVQTAASLLGRKKQWEREDNAVQRRAADLEAAGLSKTLAAGTAAQASPTQINTGSGFADAGKIMKEIPIQKAQRTLMEANAVKAEADAENTGFQNYMNSIYKQWLNTPSNKAPTWPEGTTRAGLPMWNNQEDLIQSYQGKIDQELTTQNFFNRYGLPNQPGVLQSQTGQILILNQAWSKMSQQERTEFLKAYGAKTLADVAGKLFGSAAGSLGTAIGTP